MRFETVPPIYLEPRILMLDNDVVFHDSVGLILCDLFNIEMCQTEEELFHHIAKDKKIEDILEECYAHSENSSDMVSVLFLNYQKLAEKLYDYYKANEFVSLVFMDYAVPKTNGLSVAMKLRNLPISRILLSDRADNTDVIRALEENLIHKFIAKDADNIANVIEDSVNEQHTSVIQNLNSDLFGRFNRLTGYGTLFSDDAFIAYYEHIRIGKNIVFSCVYETGGSMIMRDRDGQTYLFNIYSAHEIRSILFESAEFEGTISDVNKERCLAFSLIVDYKNKREGCLFDTFLSDKLTDAFHTLTVNGESYYITLKKLAG